MKIRVFTGSDLASALTALRRALGDDALILETREIAREAGGGIEILAAADSPEPPKRGPAGAPPPDIAERRADLSWHGIGTELGGRLLEADLVHALTKTLGFCDLPIDDDAAPLLFAGEPGAGKTTSLVKIATRLVMAGRTPLVISTDTRKAGATEQLAVMTRILNLTLIVADDAAQLTRAVSRRSGGAPVLIDTAGLITSSPDDEALLRSLAVAASAEIVAILPAGLDPVGSAECAIHHATLGARRMIATKLDVSRRVGGIVEASWRSRLKLTEAGTSPDIAGGLEPLTAAMLAGRLLSREAHGAGTARPPEEMRI